jgi:hypothetical protein
MTAGERSRAPAGRPVVKAGVREILHVDQEAGEPMVWRSTLCSAALGGVAVLATVGASGWYERVPEVVELRLVARELIEESPTERLYNLVLEDGGSGRIEAYLRRPLVRTEEGNGSQVLPGVILVAGRYTGRDAAKLIPGPLTSVMLAVEYPQTIPARVEVWEWVRGLPSIRRSARRMPGILRGVARLMAELPEVDGARIGLVGVSFGVPFAAAAGKDRVFTAVALHYGGSDLGSLFRANLPLKNSLLRGGVAMFAGWWFRELDPGRHVAAISPTPLLLINAIGDDLVPERSARRLARLARPPVHQIWLPYGHLRSGEVEVIREVADSTFRYFESNTTGQ